MSFFTRPIIVFLLNEGTHRFMKILLVCQHYYPEPFRVTRIAENLVKDGNEVTVLTGIPNYPEGHYYPGYSKKENREQTINGVHIIRAFEHPRKKGVLHRVWNYYSFPFHGSRIAKKLKERFDCILTIGLSPIMMARPAIAYKKKWGTPILMYEMDLWPESLLAGGIKKGSFVYNHYKKVSAKIYSQMDRILVTSEAHIEYIESLIGKKEGRIAWLPQFADDILSAHPAQKPSGGPTTFLFAGNIGKAQSCITILEAAKKWRDSNKVRFLFVGSGSELDNLKAFKEENKLDNVIFEGRVPLSEMQKYYDLADAAIVSLAGDEYCKKTVPGKVQSYLKAGLPILSIDSGATSKWIDGIGCGFTCPAEDVEGFVGIVERFMSLSMEEKVELSKKSKSFYENKLTESNFMDRLKCCLSSIITNN